MQTFKPKPKELKELIEAAVCLKDANDALARGKKESEAAKEKLTQWLAGRGVDLAALPVGEMVQIDGVAFIEIAKMNKFDEKGFLLAEPALHCKWRKDIPVRKFKPLV